MHRPSSRLRRAAVPALAIALAGCSFFGDDGASSTTTTIAAATTTTTIPVAPPAIEVLDPGGSPRELIRYDLTSGVTVDLTVSTSITIRQETTGRPPTEVVIPEVIQDLRLRIGAVDGDRAELEMEVVGGHLAEGSGLVEAEAKAMEESLSDLAGSTGRGEISSDGQLRNFAWDDLSAFSPELRMTIESFASQFPALVAPLPSTAVGPGATWRATSKPFIGGVASEVITTYTMNGVLGTALSYSSVTTTVTDDRDLPEGTVEGATASIVGSRSTALASGVTDLASLMTEATIGTRVEQDIVIAHDASTSTTHQTMSVDTKVTIT